MVQEFVEVSEPISQFTKPANRHVILPLEYVSPMKRFLHQDIVGSGLLLLAALVAVVVANSSLYDAYHSLWTRPFGLALGDFSFSKELHLWVNDGLMAVFFFLVGMEIKRELLAGELTSFRKAMLPAVAALGGMIVPAIIFSMFNSNGEGQSGWGVPMATDIAFAAGCIALLKRWVPSSLVIFLVALAIVDDLGAVAVIAIFYTGGIALSPLIGGLSVLLFAFALNRMGVRSMLPYALLGAALWLFFLDSGVHATVAGVLLAFIIPADSRYATSQFEGRMKELLARFVKAESEWDEASEDHQPRLTREWYVNHRQQALLRGMNVECKHVEAPLQRLEHNLSPFCIFVVMPIFAFANAGVHLEWSEIGHLLMQPVTLGILFGLLIGKPLGIVLFSYLTVKLGIAELPRGVNWGQILGVGILAGVGFTMSLFINELAFIQGSESLVASGKLGIFLASILAAVMGLIVLKLTCRQEQRGVGAMHQ